METLEINDKVLWLKTWGRDAVPTPAVFLGYVGKNGKSAKIRVGKREHVVRIRTIKKPQS